MGFKDNLNKLKELASSAKDKAVDLVSEEVVEYEAGPGGRPVSKRKLKQWVKTTGAVAASVAAVVAVKKGYDAMESNTNEQKRLDPSNDFKKLMASRSNNPKAIASGHDATISKSISNAQPSKAKEVAGAIGAFFGGFVSGAANFQDYDTSLDNLIKSSSNIESMLENKGAVGKGLHEKVSSVENMIPESSVKSIRFIASIRNQLVHEGPDTVTIEKKRDYLEACQRVERDLNSYN